MTSGATPKTSVNGKESPPAQDGERHPLSGRTNSDMRIFPMKQSHIQSVVTVHLDAFPGFFLSGLGRRFLSLFYTSVIEDHSCISLVAGSDQQIDGFIVGTVEPRGFYKRILLRKGIRFVLAALKPLIAKPRIIRRLLRGLSKNEVHRPPRSALVMSIAVRQAAQGRAIGRELVSTFLEECRKRGSRNVYLTTDELDNARTNRFYASMGFTVSRMFTTPEGRKMNEYEIKLEEDSGSAVNQRRA